MKSIYLIIALAPFFAQAQQTDNASPGQAQQDSGTVLGESDPEAVEVAIPESSLKSPNAKAEDVGMAQPGSSVDLSDINGSDEAKKSSE